MAASSAVAMTRIRSYGSTDFRPGTDWNGAEPSTGAHETSVIGVSARRFKASDSRPAVAIRPRSRHSSVRPSNGTTADAARSSAAAIGLDSASAGLRRRKSNGTAPPRSVLGATRIVADRLDDARIRERRRVAEVAALGDVTQEPAHDLAGA